METFKIENDIKVLCVKASSFPQGIEEAHKTLQRLIPSLEKRGHFGISRPEKGTIVYKAAAEMLDESEAAAYGLETFVIPKGTYLCETLHNFPKNMSAIGDIFNKMTRREDIDPNGFCLECYLDEKDVRCMVPLKS